MPIMAIDGRTRATPYGNMISTSAVEKIRLGQFVQDPSSNAILYIKEDT